MYNNIGVSFHETVPLKPKYVNHGKGQLQKIKYEVKQAVGT